MEEQNESKYVHLSTEWLLWRGLDTNFEQMSKTVLADTLREFYPSVRQAPENYEHEGEPYAKQSLINIRSAISPHLQLTPHNKSWDLMQDKDFLAANRVFQGSFHTIFMQN